VAHVNVEVTRWLRWRYWSRYSAVAVGRIGISTVGWERLNLKLTRPKTLCIHTVFTRAHFDVHLRYGEYRDRYQYTIRLDTPLDAIEGAGYCPV
jgi:hypothetical protein